MRLAPIVGIALSQVITFVPKQLGMLLGVFGGAFLAIGASHLLPEVAAPPERVGVAARDPRRRRRGARCRGARAYSLAARQSDRECASAAAAADAVISVTDLHRHYGDVKAVDGVSSK